MNKNPIEQHLKKALISSNNPEGSVVDDKVVLSSTMTPVHKTLLVIFLLIIIAVIVASQARIDIVVSVRGELLLDSDIEKVQHLEGGY
ncbi:HlyD family secretion protein [Vibrio astriarenae]|nr:HlyD family secretion protein [Vibrio sp. C7]